MKTSITDASKLTFGKQLQLQNTDKTLLSFIK